MTFDSGKISTPKMQNVKKMPGLKFLLSDYILQIIYCLFVNHNQF